MTIILSSGSCLTLLLAGGLILASNTVHTSDIQRASAELNRLNVVETTEPASNGTVEEPVARATGGHESRRRSGRLYGSSQQSQQSTLDSYAAAYAAANSPNSASESSSSHLGQSTVQANEASAYSSFGEQLPSPTGPTSSSSAARQLPIADYAPHSSYYVGHVSPSSNEVSYGNQQAGSNNYHAHHYSPSYYKSSPPMPLGYPTNSYADRHSAGSYYDRMAQQHVAASTPFWATSPAFGTGGLMSSASHALSHWTNGFSISEIICGLVALAIGAVILGAPFFLIYLALMGNFSGSGTLSLTNPTQASGSAGGTSATVNGRRKRLAIFEPLRSDEQSRASEYIALADSVVSQLSPFIDLQKLSTTFKRLTDSIDKFSKMKNEKTPAGDRKKLL